MTISTGFYGTLHRPVNKVLGRMNLNYMLVTLKYSTISNGSQFKLFHKKRTPANSILATGYLVATKFFAIGYFITSFISNIQFQFYIIRNRCKNILNLHLK